MRTPNADALSFAGCRGRSAAAWAVLLAVSGWAGAARAEKSELPPELGWDQGQVETPTITAASGARRALGGGMDAVFMNPANTAAARLTDIGVLATFWPEANRQTYGGAIVDYSRESQKLAGGFGIAHTAQDSEGVDRRMLDVRLALGYPLSDAVLLGITGRYLTVRQDGLGPLGRSPASGGLRDEKIVNGFGFDAGLTVTPMTGLALALVGTSLQSPGQGFEPFVLGTGIGYGTGDFSIEVDGTADFTTWGRTTYRGMGSATYLAADNFPLRVGYRYDEAFKQHAVSGGVGYLTGEYSIDAGVRRTLGDWGATTVSVSISLHNLGG